jgi:hypothetical protein
MIITDETDLSQATRKYAGESLQHPRILAAHWRRMLPELRQRVRDTDLMFRRWYGPDVGECRER